MTTKNFVPRIDGEGQVGTETKKWSKIYSNSIYVNNIIGDLNGTSDNAIKDNKNQQIDSTYIKNISVNNDTLTVTKGNGSTSTITVNNVANATKATQDKNGLEIDTGYLKLTGGTLSGNITTNNTAFQNAWEILDANLNLSLGFINDSSFPRFYVYDRNVSKNIITYNKDTRVLSFVGNNSVLSNTPPISDNSTRVATTAFVQSLINSLKSSIGGTISAASLNTNGYVKFSNGFIIQWGKHYYNNDNPWVSFPISFTSACYSVVASFADTIATVGDALKTTDISKNRFAIDANYKYINVCYIAIGR